MSSSSREYSPDWLRNVQAPPAFTLSSSSDDDDDQLPIRSVMSSPPKTTTKDTNLSKDDDDDDVFEEKPPSKFNNSSKPSTLTKTKHNTLTKQDIDDDTRNQTGSYISSSTLPLLLSDKIQRSKVLVECEGESIDLSGDLGSVGRVVISDSPSANQDMLLDLKGTIYKTTIIPSRTFCVVSFGQSEAKIEAIMNDFIQLKPQSNVYEAETMVEGTLEGFSFDSEDEGDKPTIRQTDENEGADPQTNRKGRGKSDKTSDAAKKRGKTAVKKPAAAAKKAKKKAPVAKKTKTKK